MALQTQATSAESVEESIDEFPETTTSFSRGCCCFWNLGSRKSIWERILASGREPEGSDEGWWGRGVEALKKVREWSELVAGPKWKTFIRRFNKSDGRLRPAAKFQYDPSSYALNFDEGQVGEFGEDRFHRNLSTAHIAIC